MAFREVAVTEIREVLRAWLAGAGLRQVAAQAGVDRKTARRYVQAAVEAGLAREAGAGQLSDELIGQVAEVVRPVRPGGPPILIGGEGEARTLRTVATYADRCNFHGQAANVSAKLAVLKQHCADVGRDPSEIRVTRLGALCPTRSAAALYVLTPLVLTRRPPCESRVGRLYLLAAVVKNRQLPHRWQYCRITKSLSLLPIGTIIFAA